MSVTGTNELARMRALQARAISVRNDLDRASTEATTFEKSDRYTAAGGNLTRLFAIEQSLGRNTVYARNITLIEQRLTVMQNVAGSVQSSAQNLSLDLLNATGLGDEAAVATHATTARSDFAATVGFLNTSVGGQSLFAGTRTDTAAVAPADAILADLDALSAGATSAADVVDAINNYFAPGGGFFTTRYTGSPNDLTPVAIGDGQRVDYGVLATADEFLATLRGQAMAAVIAGGAATLASTERLALAEEAGNQLLEAKEGLLDLGSRIAVNQERVERAKAARVAERDTLEQGQAEIIGVDPLDAVAAQTSLETQLQTIYTITSRLLDLRFINFMS